METIKKISAKNMQSNNSNGTIPNQFEIRTPEGVYFQSYSTVIAFVPNNGGKTILDPNWTYSNTTGKYRNQFLGEDRKQTEKKIKDGTYLVQSLN